MSEKRPNVFPTREERDKVIKEIDNNAIDNFEQEKIQAVTEIINTSANLPSSIEIPSVGGQPSRIYDANSHQSAVEQMKSRIEYELALRNQSGDYSGVVKYPHLAEKSERPTRQVVDDSVQRRSEDQLRARDEQVRKNQEMIDNYQRQLAEASNRRTQPNKEVMENKYVPPTPPSKPPVNTIESFGENPSNIDPHIIELSQPNYNTSFDVIPLPSEGKLYPNKKPSVKVSYMTTTDENILTSPNLLKSGQFLQILMNRKILEPTLRYENLHVGDRNAIMIWLRATSYGNMYPVSLFDENDEVFDTEIDLSGLKYKKLGAEPDNEGLFYYVLPISKTPIKFKFLTCGDIDDIDRLIELDVKNGALLDNSSIYKLERMIVEINSSRDKRFIKEFVASMRIGDSDGFKKYVDDIESGVDLEIEVGTPGGGSVKTFLPLNLKFFWPKFGV